MVPLELTYLYQLGRIGEPAARIVDELREQIALTVCPAPFHAVTLEAERHSWTQEPFDRLIVAQSSLHDAPLLTADSIIRQHYARAVWVSPEAVAEMGRGPFETLVPRDDPE